jgi:hypothetical protein
MPDNVSLTVSEINGIKQTNDTLLSRLKRKTFTFADNKTTNKNDKSLPIIGDTNNQGMVVYAAYNDIQLKKNLNNKITFKLTDCKFVGSPVIQATVASTQNVSKYQISTNVVYHGGTTNSIDVWISVGATDKDHKLSNTKTLSLNIHVLAIGYA